jgi:hypothetical protein
LSLAACGAVVKGHWLAFANSLVQPIRLNPPATRRIVWNTPKRIEIRLPNATLLDVAQPQDGIKRAPCTSKNGWVDVISQRGQTEEIIQAAQNVQTFRSLSRDLLTLRQTTLAVPAFGILLSGDFINPKR